MAEMTYRKACAAFGNGDIGRGRAVIMSIAERLFEAREKHPVHAVSKEDSLAVIGAEFGELVNAVTCGEGRGRELDESLDVIATAVRFINGEWELNSDVHRD